MSADVRIYRDRDALSREVAGAIAHRMDETLTATGYFTLSLAGGQTPRTLYRVLATQYRDTISWSRLHLYWGDERYVPQNDPRSNYRLVRESLLDHVPIPGENVHPIPTDFPEAEDAALAYEQMLREWFRSSWPRFDLVLLGMGPDGHTAPLFPGSPALAERSRWVVAARAPVDPRLRLTLTPPVLNAASLVFFLVVGSEKADVLHRVLTAASGPVPYPAAAIRPERCAVVWWVDEHAAQCVPRSGTPTQGRR